MTTSSYKMMKSGILLCGTICLLCSSGAVCLVVEAWSIQKAPTRSQSSLILSLAPQQLGSFEALNVADRRLVRSNFYGIVDDEAPIAFADTWKVQQDLQVAHFDQLSLAGGNKPSEGTEQSARQEAPLDTLLFVQHESVYTFGTASDRSFLLNQNTGIPLADINRGGEITYHGPGQLVVYPILNLRNYQADLHWYMRALEEAVIHALFLLDSDVKPARCEETTGVWVENRKVAAIGVSARRWITQHGVAINVEEVCMDAFEHIIPCGLEGRRVGCLNQFLKHPISVQEFVPYMVKAMEHVFEINIQIDNHIAKNGKVAQPAQK
mmetsp:Transcript_19016/g.24490  ORF Transcript_19016/g.24490 Transcript_19016/m.24490 type:complete len:323 (+) Transcript_19016:102-1070(+)|eukprot:CAMPEP_0198150096 /NCGR_PEP_ID=MMETSP1443-20131203/49381_1 /TAXON_ID=186043 /ORGANISM="Entomoneis sp., Strain CCMP2396" /LENGTH=322 /DNA_ID=CAMNT_0043815303 /DNA_START=76 /DNA_END=1044 /DNA_ORIENTATION=+